MLMVSLPRLLPTCGAAFAALIAFLLLTTVSSGEARGRTVYDGPKVITAGGVYSGNWSSGDPNIPAVEVRTVQPVVIKNSNLRGKGHLIQTTVRDANLTVIDTVGEGLNPGVSGRYPGRFVKAEYPSNLRVENNLLNHTSGIYILGFANKPESGGTVKVRYNRSRNIDGRYSTGSGYSDTNFYRVQFLQLNQVKNVPGMEVAWNEVVNEPYKSRVEDNISVYKSRGTPASPLDIHHNYIQGAYPALPNSQGYSGGGIVTDGEAQVESDATAYVKVHHNRVIDTTNYGVAIYAGHDVELYANRTVSDGRLPDGTQAYAQNVGNYCWNGKQASSSVFYNNSIRDSVSGWTKGAARNDYWFAPNAPGCDGGNSRLAQTVTQETETREKAAWNEEVRITGTRIGPRP
jgi:hypothetical protein